MKKVQIVTNNKAKFTSWNVGNVCTLSQPFSFDSFRVNVVDASYDGLWRNDGNTTSQINCQADFRTIKSILVNSNNSFTVIVLPQNIKMKYHMEYIAGKNTRDYSDSVWLKDSLRTLTENILSSLVPYTYAYRLLYENSLTDIENRKLKASFYFDGTYLEPKKILTASQESNKATTIQYCDRIILTTLDAFESEETFKAYLRYLGLTERERPTYPEWLISMPMFDDLQLVKEIDAFNRIIAEINTKKATHEEKLLDNMRYKSILITNGSALVEDVFKILEQILSCDLSEFEDKKREDFLIELEHVVFIGEIKGVTSNVKSEHVSQIDVHYQGYMDNLTEKNVEVNKKVKQLLIVNPFRTKPVDEREPVHTIQISLAERNGCLIIDTMTLLRIFERFRGHTLSTEQIIDVFSNKSGLLKLDDFETETET